MTFTEDEINEFEKLFNNRGFVDTKIELVFGWIRAHDKRLLERMKKAPR